MEDDELRALAEHIVAAIARVDQRCDLLEQQQQAFLQQAYGAFEEQTGRWLQTVAGQFEHVARSGLESPLAEGRRSMQGIAAEADQTARTLQGTRRDVASVLHWVWIGTAVSLVFSIVALVGTYEMVYGYYQTKFNELKSQVTYLDAINRSDVVPCGDGRLCARIDDKAPRAGDKKQYRLIEPRP